MKKLFLAAGIAGLLLCNFASAAVTRQFIQGSDTANYELICVQNGQKVAEERPIRNVTAFYNDNGTLVSVAYTYYNGPTNNFQSFNIGQGTTCRLGSM